MSDVSKSVVAKAVRLEYNEKDGETYIVFKVENEDFKNRIKNDWMKDIELKVIGKDLIEIK